jgi:hypothetical protein
LSHKGCATQDLDCPSFSDIDTGKQGKEEKKKEKAGRQAHG